MYGGWIGTVPVIFFSIIGGALSDVFGRKPLMLFPLIGYFLSSTVNIICYAFIESIPVNFFYLNRISSFFGGYSVLWLGVYGYGASVTKNDDRTFRLTRLDGVETISKVVGTLLSPYVFEYMGYYGNFCLCTLMIGIAILYLVFFVTEATIIQKQKEVITEKMDDATDMSICLRLAARAKSMMRISVMVPLQGIRNVICKDRKTILKFLITLQVLCYLIYTSLWQVSRLTYLYMMLVFDSFTPKDYAHLKVGVALLQSSFLLFVMPVVSGKLKIHDALLLGIIVCFEVLSGSLKPFATSPWIFSLIYMLGSAGMCKYGILRSLLSKSIGSDEVGKFFSLLAICASVGPIIAGPALRQLYNYTMNTCPGAIFFVFAGIMTLAAIFNFGIFFLRRHLKPVEESATHDVKNNAAE